MKYIFNIVNVFVLQLGELQPTKMSINSIY